MALAAGSRLGPYEVLGLIGAGGMGAVYRARDPRLGRDVAIKVLPDAIASDPDRLRRFAQEARAVAALNHPHILTIHDVGTDAGVPYVVTELLEGETWRQVLMRRAPTPRQVLTFARQAAQGLAAAHAKGIVHRDLKPENLFLTTDGRVKILDFGLARQTAPVDRGRDAATMSSPIAPNVLVGTLAYMSPEQVQAQMVDARADVFAFGVVLYEMLTGQHPFRRETVAATLTAILQEGPPPLTRPERAIPPAVDGIVRRCLEKAREDRYPGAHELAVALDAVLQAPTGAASLQEVEERSPYPGLRPFTEKDAAVFFGREEEVTAFWRRIRARALLAVIGPSGAGKTSFLRAGVIPARPDGWAAIACTPGTAPLRALGQALAPALASDPEALSLLVSFDDPEVAFTLVRRWRQAHGDALVVFDQFEELFTLNPPEVAATVASLIGRLVTDADLHVVLSLRDDFLIRCSEHRPLAPVFSEVTPLVALTADNLRRALVEPAGKRGYRFEDDALVDEMVDCVEGTRAALPLLAFAVARLWDMRDGEQHVLTRSAYEQIGGVAGALAQHAEATLDRIGSMQQDLVRELFRNLVTAQGTRAVMDRDELLSTIPDRAAAKTVLRELVDARLLTSYEVEGQEGEPSRHRVEIVHESLLKAWPRLVRWQTQDEDGAVLRDQLKQAAHLWEEKGRTADLLWTGTAFQEYALWRERYPGALTALEEDFTRAMAMRAQRRRRVRRAALAAIVIALSVVTIAIGVSRQQAVVGARRAEAGRLIALGRVELERNPAAALACARASLDAAESAEGRLLAVQALWAGPPAFFTADGGECYRVAFSPDGRRLACSGFGDSVTVHSDDGGGPVRIGGLPTMPDLRGVAFTTRGDRLLTWLAGDPSIRIWSVTGEPVGSLAGEAQEVLVISDDTVATYGAYEPDTPDRGVRVWSLREQASRLVARWRPPPGFRVDLIGLRPAALHPSLRSLAYASDGAVHLLGLTDRDSGRDAVLGTHEATVREVAFGSDGGRLLSVDENGTFRIWSVAEREVVRTIDASVPRRYSPPSFDASGSSVAWASGNSFFVWNLEDPPGTSPLGLQPVRTAGGTSNLGAAVFEPRSRWVAGGSEYGASLWSLASSYPRVLSGHTQELLSLAFTADSTHLASCARDGARIWPLLPSGGRQRLISLGRDYFCYGVSADPETQDLLVVAPVLGAFLVKPDGTTPKRIEGIPATVLSGSALDTRAHVAAVGVEFAPEAKDMVIHVADLASGATRTIATREPVDQRPDAGAVGSLGFLTDGSLVSGGDGGVFRWDPVSGARTRLAGAPGQMSRIALNRLGTRLIAALSRLTDPNSSEILIIDPMTGTLRPILSHGRGVSAVAIDSAGERIATGDVTGVVRVGRATGEEPHLLLGRRDAIAAVALSPDGKWVASAGGNEIRLWPMPDLSKPPLHTLPHEALLAKLDALTNVRVVEDKTSATGYKVAIGPFPGWKDVPTW